MLTKLQESSEAKGTILVSKQPPFLSWQLDPGKATDTEMEVFIPAHPAKKYRARKALHQGPYYTGSKVMVAVVLVFQILAAFSFMWFLTRFLGSDSRVIGEYHVGSCDPTCRYYTVTEPFWDKSTWARNIATYAGITALGWYMQVWVRQLATQVTVLYTDVRTKFARNSVDTPIDMEDEHWSVFDASLQDALTKLEIKPDTAKLAELDGMMAKIKEISGESHAEDIEALQVEIESLSTRPPTVTGLMCKFDVLLAQSEPSVISVAACSAVSRFFINIDRFVDEKEGADAGQTAKLNKHIRRLADKETARFAPQLVVDELERRFNRVLAAVEDLSDEVSEWSNKNQSIDLLIKVDEDISQFEV